MRKKIEELRELARRAVQWTSFDPVERGEQQLRTADETLEAFLAKLPEEVRDTYEERFCEKLADWYRAKSRCASAAVVGPAAYNIRREEKMQQWADNALKRLEEWMSAVVKRTNREHRPVGWAKVEVLRSKVEKLTEEHEIMLKANSIVRTYRSKLTLEEMRQSEELRDDMAAAWLDDETIRETMHQREDGSYYDNGIGFGTFTISNYRKKLQDARSRLEQAERMAERKDRTIEGDGCKVQLCYTDERVRIIYDGKPDTATIQKLKQGAFRWSPKNKAWQRQITMAALAAASNITKIDYEQLK